MNDNKLIAEFMGLTEPYELPQHGTIRPNGDFKTEFTLDQLKYNSSWDWLMPVVGKIEKTPNIYDIEEFLLIRDELCTARIETIYDSVVEFIKWYNANKQTT